jgi:hypothetical protein
MLRNKKELIHAQELEFYDLSLESPHRKMINKQKAMVQWQIDYTPGYLGIFYICLYLCIYVFIYIYMYIHISKKLWFSGKSTTHLDI